MDLMPSHPIDTEALRARLAPLAWHSTPPITTDHVRRVLDALAAAEHRVTRAEMRIKAVEDVLYASDDGTEYEHNHGALDDCGDDCPACWVQTIRRALDGDA